MRLLCCGLHVWAAWEVSETDPGASTTLIRLHTIVSQRVQVSVENEFLGYRPRDTSMLGPPTSTDSPFLIPVLQSFDPPAKARDLLWCNSPPPLINESVL